MFSFSFPKYSFLNQRTLDIIENCHFLSVSHDCYARFYKQTLQLALPPSPISPASTLPCACYHGHTCLLGIPPAHQAYFPIRHLHYFLMFLFLFFASKQSRYYRKANSSQDSWEGGEEPPSLLSYRGFYPLKMGVTNMGSRKMWSSPIGLAQLLISVFVQ